MIIRSLELQNYRNYKNSLFNLAEGINVFYGDNAQGKTNALESIFMCGVGKSHKGTKDKDIINFNEEEAHVRLSVEKEGIPHRIDVHLKKTGRKGIAIDGIPIKKASELYGFMHVIIFSPEDLSIIKDSPQIRRNFIDMELCQIDKIYTNNLINYNRLIIQKNKLLKQLDDDPSLADTIPVWNEQLIKYGTQVILKRRQFISKINEIIKDIHKGVTNGEEEIDLIYNPNSDEQELKNHLLYDFGREIAARMALFGPHRDDISFIINGINAREFGSQGQQRTAALSLKLSEIEMIKQNINDEPILLLDDVLSELDAGRQKRLLTELKGVQTIITCTGLEDIPEGKLKIDKTFTVKNGNVDKETE